MKTDSEKGMEGESGGDFLLFLVYELWQKTLKTKLIIK